MKKTVPALIAVLFAIALVAFTTKTANDPWPVPDAYKNKANPRTSNAESLANGKTLWNQHCKSCHGSKGKGDGPKAAQLDTDCGDFTKPAFKNQTDGSMYYKTEKGRKDMPSYKTKIPDANDLWDLVNYMKSL